MRRLMPVIACLSVAACGDDTSNPATTSTADTSVATEVSSDTSVAPDTTPTTTATEVIEDTSVADTSPPEPTPVCVAIRGNGELITSHFAALAEIAEHFGPFEGVAGGSSGSISAFLTESMHMHPGITTCGDAPCTRAAAGARLALLYKSLFGYIGAMGDTDEAVAVAAILKVIALAQEKGIGTFVEGGNLQEAWNALVALLTSDEVADLVNSEVLEFLQAPDSITANVTEVWDAFTTFGNFKADSAKIFLRPGLVDFAGLADKIGRIGSFYAGYGDYDDVAWQAFFDACAEPAKGKPWPAIAALTAGDSTCGALFRGILDPWRAAFIPVETTAPNRIRDLVGAHMRALVVTSVLTGAAADTWATAKEAYFKHEAFTWPVAFSDVRIGYWGAAADTSKVVGNPLGFSDAKTAKAMTLGQATWYDALRMSPAEPGLSRGVPISAAVGVSTGGWPDLAPVLALRNAGCEHVIYLTRRGGESVFAQQIAELDGMDATTKTQLYDLANADSAFNQSLEEAAGVWCTDWNSYGATNLEGIIGDAMGAPFEVHDATLVPLSPVISQTSNAHLPGCTPGVVPPATP